MIDIRPARSVDVAEVVANALEYYSSERDLSLRLQNKVQDAYVAVDELGRIGMMFGFYQIWEGVIEVWAVTTRHFYYRKVSYTRILKRKIADGMDVQGVHRVQLFTKAKYPNLIKWAKALGFTQEGFHPKMGSDKEDYISHGRVK